MNSTSTLVKMILDRWSSALQSCDKLLNSLTDEQLNQATAPTKNNGIYILGHLIAVHDDMIRLLGFGEKVVPAYFDVFIKAPYSADATLPNAAELRLNWTKMNEVLSQKMNALSEANWLEAHTAVSAEDFAKEPHRNKLNIILTRTTHLTYHTGQLTLLNR